MTRISKASVNHALDVAAKNLLDAKGNDNVISRAEVKAKLGTLQGTEKKLTDIFFQFVDHRDHVSGARVTAEDVKKAVTYAREHIIAAYDLDHNGLSASEISKMSATGKLAVQLARELKTAAVDPPPANATTGAAVAKELAKLAKDLTYMSESDEPYKAFSVAMDKNTPLTGENLKAAAHLAANVTLGERNVAEFFADTQNPDNVAAEGGAKYLLLQQALNSKLTDVKLFQDTNEGNIQGKVFLVGRLPDGTVAGLQSMRVWT
jgi:hypothetical protein